MFQIPQARPCANPKQARPKANPLSSLFAPDDIPWNDTT